MNESQMEQRYKKAFAVAELAYDSIKEALFQLETMKPLISDPRIIEPLNKTYAAHTLGLLQWTLFGAAAINLCKAVYDADRRSGGLAVLFHMLEDDNLLAAIRAKRTAPVAKYGRPLGIDPHDWAAIRKAYEEEDRAAAEAEFDATYPELRSSFEALQGNEAGERLRQVRNKVLAHDSLRFCDGSYSAALPENFDLKWGDAEAFAKEASTLATRVFQVLFGHHPAIDEVQEIYREYSEDFWRCFRPDLPVSAGSDN